MAASRSAAGGGAVSKKEHQAKSAGGPAAEEAGGPGMEPAQGKGTCACAPRCGASLPVFERSRLPQVTEEVLSVLRLLSPLTEPESSLPEPSEEENRLDAALAQLQNVARKLAMSHTTQVNMEPYTLSRGT